MSDWIDIRDRLPLYGPDDPLYVGGFYEIDVFVLVNGKEREAVFWACWESYHPAAPDNYNYPFLMGFDEDGVTHWRHNDTKES